RIKAGNGVHQRGLAGTIGPDQAENAALLDVQGNVLQRLNAPEPAAQVVALQHIIVTPAVIVCQAAPPHQKNESHQLWLRQPSVLAAPDAGPAGCRAWSRSSPRDPRVSLVPVFSRVSSNGWPDLYQQSNADVH